MPGEQLTCVMQCAYEKYGGSSLQRSALSKLFSRIHADKCLCYTKTDFLTFDDVVKFRQLKEFILSKRDTNCTKREIQDKIELACWNQCKTVYSKCLFAQSEVFKLWQIFNRIADEESYPLVLSKLQASWILQKFAFIANNDTQLTVVPASLTFKDFLSWLEKMFDVRSAVLATKEIHEWLVKEIIKADWVFVRVKRRFNWSHWSKKWVCLMPGKLQISKNKNEKQSIMTSKITFYISEETHIQKTESEVNRTSGIDISSPVFHCHFATMSVNAVELWLKAFDESLRNYLEDTSAIHLILNADIQDDIEEAATSCFKEREKSFKRFKTLRIERKSKKIKGFDESQKHTINSFLLRSNSANTNRKKIKAVFLEFDKDGNGFLEKQEFCLALKEMGLLNINETESGDIFNNIDKDRNGKIMFDEFYEYFIENVLCEEKHFLRKAFFEADKKQKGVVNFKEFSEFVRNVNASVSLEKVLSTFDKLCGENNEEELSYQDFENVSILEELGLFPSSLDSFEAQLKSRFDTSNSSILRRKIKDRWNKFASFKRLGENRQTVMTGASNIVDDFVPGEYNLKDLANLNDLPTILPKMTVVRGVSWESSNIPNTSGNLVFPSDFNGVIEVEIATNELLSYYQCSFADRNSATVYLPYRHAVQDFTYKADYLTNYVENKNGGAGLERHAFSHIDCPVGAESGLFILGKLTEDELHLTAFKIPRRQTLYVPGYCIHSNDYLKGTWRTMLSDEANIDHVYLKRRITEGDEKGSSLESFTFQFS